MSSAPPTGEHGFATSEGFGGTAPPALASRRHTFRFVVIVLGIAVVGILQAPHAASSLTAARIPLYLSVVALQLLFVWFINKGIRPLGHSFLDLVGRRWHSASDAGIDLFLAVAFVGLLRGCTFILHHLLGRAGSNTAFLLPHGAIESAVWVAVAISAGGCEELVYRGYLQRQLWFLSGRLPLAILMQSAIFALTHVYQGWRAAALTVVYGLAFGLLAAWRRSIVPGAIAHGLIDIISGLTRH